MRNRLNAKTEDGHEQGLAFFVLRAIR